VAVDTNRNNKGMGGSINITMYPEAVVVVVDTTNLINPNTTRMVVAVAVVDLPMVVAVVDLLMVATKVRSIHAQNYTWDVLLAKRVSPLMTFRNDPVVTYKSIRMFHPDKTVKLPLKGRDLVLKAPSKCFPKSYRWVPIIPMLGVVEVEVVVVAAMVSMVSRLDTVTKIPMGNKPVITNLTVSQLIVNHHLSNNHNKCPMVSNSNISSPMVSSSNKFTINPSNNPSSPMVNSLNKPMDIRVNKPKDTMGWGEV